LGHPVYKNLVEGVSLYTGVLHCTCAGDSGYPTEPWLLTPLAAPCTPAETAYNSAHARTRNIIERKCHVAFRNTSDWLN